MTRNFPMVFAREPEMKNKKPMAVWALTSSGASLALKIAENYPEADIYLGRKIRNHSISRALYFERLVDAVKEQFTSYSVHVFIMAAGIAVRMIAPRLNSKHDDPAVVVVDDSGRYAISLLSGHSAGANKITGAIAEILEAEPVITTATDNAAVPAVDLLARKHRLQVDNPEAVKRVSMTLLEGKIPERYDPLGILDRELKEYTRALPEPAFSGPGIYVYHELMELPEDVLVLRPKSLFAGLGCNSSTSAGELEDVLRAAFKEYSFSLSCVELLATIREKIEEPGLVKLSRRLNVPLVGFTRNILSLAGEVPNPSRVVQKYMGVPSVCEAAAITAANKGSLLIPKIKSGNVTLAVARKSFM